MQFINPHDVTRGLAYILYVGLLAGSVAFAQVRVGRPETRATITVLLVVAFAVLFLPYMFIGPCLLDSYHCL